MKINTGFKDALTFSASILVGCGAAIAMASAAAVSQVAPLKSAPEVVRLDPVVVTVSKARFDTIRNEESALVHANDTRKVARG